MEKYNKDYAYCVGRTTSEAQTSVRIAEGTFHSASLFKKL